MNRAYLSSQNMLSSRDMQLSTQLQFVTRLRMCGIPFPHTSSGYKHMVCWIAQGNNLIFSGFIDYHIIQSTKNSIKKCANSEVYLVNIRHVVFWHMIPHYSTWISGYQCFIWKTASVFKGEDGGSTFPWNVGTQLPNYNVMPQSRWPQYGHKKHDYIMWHNVRSENGTKLMNVKIYKEPATVILVRLAGKLHPNYAI